MSFTFAVLKFETSNCEIRGIPPVTCADTPENILDMLVAMDVSR